MKWIHSLTAVVAIMGMNASAEAGLFSMFGGDRCGAAKCTDYTPTCQPRCCKPTIVRPCCPQTFEYQRKVSSLQAPCCKPDCCGDKGPSCCAPLSCPKGGCPQDGCSTNKFCPPKCSAPKSPPRGCTPTGPGCTSNGPGCTPSGPGCASNGPDCAAPCGDGCGPVCCGDNRCSDDPCLIAELIYKSQTACYADDRADAIDDLGDDYCCLCNPEIMAAFVYALNDCDEDVRAEAADEIGDQVREYGCCCMCDKAVKALTMALADCDREVRHEAEEALELCGYEIVDCCKPSCGAGCGPKCGTCPPECCAPGAKASPIPKKGGKKGGKSGGETGPAPPAPAEEKSARSIFPIRRNSKLRNLFGLLK